MILRTAVSGMRQELGSPAAVDLRRLFLSPRSHLRLTRAPALPARNRPAPAEHVALCGASASAGELSSQSPGRLHSASQRDPLSSENWRAAALHQERRRLPAHAELQRSRGRGGAGAGAQASGSTRWRARRPATWRMPWRRRPRARDSRPGSSSRPTLSRRRF